ncbi:hypothetical protein WC1_02510 [Citrobacter sp. KTE30]|uniref:hypothetical protein n=1 Tax=Citrobacter sp. KTE30 TaxID=1169319 RepID=UPI00032EC56F|nr:hypothetical protein [Citrobacter sp. KTE30]EOQ22952.1 hypothetical protein WC1_02510 [Citrobacter sp. KTE30]
MASQQTIMHEMQIHPQVLNVDLHVLPDFTGRVVLYIEKWRVTCDRRLLDDEHICALDTFIEMAREMELRLEEISND